MASKFTTTNGNTEVQFSWTAPTATIQSIAGGAAEALWNRGLGDHGTEEAPVLFTSLSNTQKLIIIENYLKDVIVDLANQNKVNKAVEVTKATEEETKYTI